MGSNRIGKVFQVTTFGESHGCAMGAVIDGCPSGLEITEEEIQMELERRRPGLSRHTSPRKERDRVEILSGIFEGKTTGAPIALLIKNEDGRRDAYEPIKDILRPGHANYTYLKKYGIFDYRGGGRASARETVARVAAGAIARKLIAPIVCKAKVIEVGGEKDPKRIDELLDQMVTEGDSIGAVIECEIYNVPAGLGDPIYDKLEAQLGSAMLSIPATRGVEFGEGFHAAKMKGSMHNDEYGLDEKGNIRSLTNRHGGILAGISTGEVIVFRVPFKPTSSIKKSQKSVDLSGHEVPFILPEGSRHDPCVALRAPSIVEAMASLVLADSLLVQKSYTR
jgi:chorismate synthase